MPRSDGNVNVVLHFAKQFNTNKGYVPSCMSYKIAGGRLNKKDGLTRYGDSHVKDKTS